MAIVAVVALGFGVAFEWKNRVERDRLLGRQARCYRQAAIHHKRALECKDAEERQYPYRPAERARMLAADGVRGSVPSGGYRSWQAESEAHLHWGSRIYDEAEGLGEYLKAVEARLLVP